MKLSENFSQETCKVNTPRQCHRLSEFANSVFKLFVSRNFPKEKKEDGIKNNRMPTPSGKMGNRPVKIDSETTTGDTNDDDDDDGHQPLVECFLIVPISRL